MGGSVVIDLIAEMQEDQSVHLTFDNLFTSLKLVECLSAKQIACTGTIRCNRIEDCPVKSINKTKKTRRGTYDYATDVNSGLLVVRWNDNNIVNVVSNKVGIHPVQTARRWSRSEKKKVDFPQPFLMTIRHYNRTMGGVDRMDQNIEKYRVSIRSKKWWWPLFMYGLDLSVQQAWHLYRQTDTSSEKGFSWLSGEPWPKCTLLELVPVLMPDVAALRPWTRGCLQQSALTGRIILSHPGLLSCVAPTAA